MKKSLYELAIAIIGICFLALANGFFNQGSGDLAAASLIAGGLCLGLAMQSRIFGWDEE